MCYATLTGLICKLRLLYSHGTERYLYVDRYTLTKSLSIADLDFTSWCAKSADAWTEICSPLFGYCFSAPVLVNSFMLLTVHGDKFGFINNFHEPANFTEKFPQPNLTN
jgi:hypothetical protein